MSIHQEIIFNYDANRIFNLLTNSDQFAEFTGAPAEINSESGGKFSTFGGMITGMTIETIPGERIIQAWRVSNWVSGVYSIVKFELEKTNNNETKLIFDHTGYPESEHPHLEQGWHNKYWEPMKKYLSA